MLLTGSFFFEILKLQTRDLNNLREDFSFSFLSTTLLIRVRENKSTTRHMLFFYCSLFQPTAACVQIKGSCGAQALSQTSLSDSLRFFKFANYWKLMQSQQCRKTSKYCYWTSLAFNTVVVILKNKRLSQDWFNKMCKKPHTLLEALFTCNMLFDFVRVLYRAVIISLSGFVLQTLHPTFFGGGCVFNYK